MNPNHDIKCWPEQFAALASGEKNFEYRKNDRGYQVGDVLLIREWNPADHDYTDQTLTRVVGHILREGFGLPSGYAVLGLKPVTPSPSDQMEPRHGPATGEAKPDNASETAGGPAPSSEVACPGADDPEERCPRHPSECTCWKVDNDHPMRKTAPPASGLLGFQERVAAAHHALFHDDPTDIEERRARFAEEVNETLQALGMSREDMHRLVDYSWERPVGEPAKEIGAALLTLTSLCVVAGYDLMACGEADLEKLQRPETIARIRAKRLTRHGRGPLPGIDPAGASEGSTR